MSDQSVNGAIRRILGQQQGEVKGTCPDANELAAYLEARLAPMEAARLEEHASACAACQQTLALSMQLEERETTAPVTALPESQRFSYRSSPLRLAIAAVVVLTVGVLLYQASRDSELLQPRPQIASRQDQGADFKQTTVAANPPGTPALAPAAARPGSRLESPRDREVAEPKPSLAQNVIPPGIPAIGAAPPANPLLDAATVARPAEPAKAEAAKAAAGEAIAELFKAKKARTDSAVPSGQAAAVRADEARLQAAMPTQQVGNVAPQVSNAAQISNAAQQAANTMAQTAGQAKPGAAAESLAVQAQPGKAMAFRDTGKEGVVMQAAPWESLQPPLAEARSLLDKGIDVDHVRKVGSRIFCRTRDYWVDAESSAHEKAPTREIRRDSKEYRDILAKEPQLAELPPGVPILLYWNATNLVIR